MTDKSIFITGAASGIGRATARCFARAGWRVGAFDVDLAGVRALADEFDPGTVVAGTMDVTDNASVEAALADFADAAGPRLDVLFNCAGVLTIGAFETLPLADHMRHADVNFAGLMRVTHAAFAYLRDSPDARVINMSSASADYGTPDFASYSATKFAVRGLTEALNLEWRRHDIHVCDVMPPFVRTAMLADAPADLTSIKRLGIKLEADDVAAVVYRAATGGRRRIHWPVSGQYKLIYYLGQVLPAWFKRGVIRLLTGY